LVETLYNRAINVFLLEFKKGMFTKVMFLISYIFLYFAIQSAFLSLLKSFIQL